MNPLIGEISLPGDKSISHRVVMFSAIASGVSTVQNLSNGKDVANTLECLVKIGAKYELENGKLTTYGKGIHSLSGNDIELDCGNSGTGLRLLCGFLAGQDLHNVSLVGDESLSKRPHNRVIDPLKQIGVDISGREGNFTPVILNGSVPHSQTVQMKVPSAQVKSAVLLAGLYANGPVTVIEIQKTRDHTENMLADMGAKINVKQNGEEYEISIFPVSSELQPLNGIIPGDPSSAAFFGVAASIVPGSDITINNLLLNPTRTGWIQVLQTMGANIDVTEGPKTFGETTGNVRIRFSELNSTDVNENIAFLIDELPILALAMACADGTSKVSNAKELRIKESDRIALVVDHLKRAGAKVEEFEDGYSITGSSLHECEIRPDDDHRIAMTFAILNYLVSGNLANDHQEIVATSFPKFFELFNNLTKTRS